MKLIADWKDAWRWLSVHIATIITVLNAAMASIVYLQGILPVKAILIINAILGVAVIFGRLIDQPKATE